MTVISESNLGEKTFRANLNTCGEFHTSEGFRRRRKLKLSEIEREAVRVSWVPASANTSKERGRDRESVGGSVKYFTVFDFNCSFWLKMYYILTHYFTAKQHHRKIWNYFLKNILYINKQSINEILIECGNSYSSIWTNLRWYFIIGWCKHLYRVYWI